MAFIVKTKGNLEHKDVLDKKYILKAINDNKNIVNKHSPLNNEMDIKGVLHIGANECQEYSFYTKDLGVKSKNIIWIDIFDYTKECKQNNPNIDISKLNFFTEAISNIDNENMLFTIAENGQSTSSLEPALHKLDHPEIKFEKNKKTLKSKTIKTFFIDNKTKFDETQFNYLSIDIQGGELMALQGAGDFLKNVNYINIEINVDETYKGCPAVEEIDSYLHNYGFKRVLESLSSIVILDPVSKKHIRKDATWGDAFYIRLPIELHNNGYQPLRWGKYDILKFKWKGKRKIIDYYKKNKRRSTNIYNIYNISKKTNKYKHKHKHKKSKSKSKSKLNNIYINI